MRTILKLNFKNRSSKRIMKKILWFMILFWLGSMLFSSGQNNVYAQGTTELTAQEQFDEKISNTNRMLDSALKLIYALLRPVLFIAWLALDNTLVYGSFLHLDASLWSLRNIMKNFANFALWFMVLFAIVKNVFSVTSSNDGEWSPTKIIKKTLIAGILIQMSWFLMAAVIDVSTILTYSIGWLPMTVLENNPNYDNMPILWVNANLGMNDDTNAKMDLNYYHTYGDKKLALCKTKKINWLTGTYIIGRSKIMIDDDVMFYSWYCALWAWPYKYKEYMTGTYAPDNINNNYKTTLNTYLSALTTWAAQWLVADCSLIPVNAMNSASTCTWYWIVENDDVFFKWEDGWLTIDSLLEKSKGFVWPFITIYSSLLDFSSISSTLSGDATLLEIFFSSVIKALFAIALFFPVLALAIVLIARVWILRLAIAMSPILALLNVFKDSIGDPFKWKTFEHFSFPNLISLIFAPVFVVFAISMSLIFITALTSRDASNVWTKAYQMAELGLERMSDGKSYSILWWLIEIELDGEELMSLNAGMDAFASFIINLFAIGIIWFFLFFAVKMTWPIWKSWWESMQEHTKNFLWSIPVVPIPGGWFVWYNAAKEIDNKFIEDKLIAEWKSDSDAKLAAAMPWMYDKLGESSNDDNTSALSKIGSWLKSDIIAWFSGGQTATQVWNSLNASQKSWLEAKWITDAWGLSDTYNTYVSNNMSEFVDSHESMLGKATEESDISTYDAENLTNSNIENMANTSWSKWWDWAKWALGGNVKTADWTFVMVNQWTHASPEFKLLKQDEYSMQYLWKSKDWEYDETKANANIKAKIESQYKKEHGDTEKMSEKFKLDMNNQIKDQQKEVNDRITLLQSKKTESSKGVFFSSTGSSLIESPP